MNCTIYIFGELSNGYTQYPDDSSSNLFKTLYSHSVAPTQIIVHRDGQLMYYTYIRKLEVTRFIGFGIVVSGYYISEFKRLFSIFENFVEKLTEKGVIINFTHSGILTSNLGKLQKEEEEVKIATDILQKQVEVLTARPLPLTDYTLAIDSQKLFSETDNINEIINASYRFGYTVLLKENDYDTVRFTNYRSLLKQLNDKNNKLIQQNEELNKINKKIQRQKKQFKNVIILIIVLIGCGIGLYYLNSNLHITKYKLDTANNTIQERDSTIVIKNSVISSLQSEITRYSKDLADETKAKEKLQRMVMQFNSYLPFIVTASNVTANSFNFDYYSLKRKEVTVVLKAINERTSEVLSNTHTLLCEEGDGNINLNFARQLDSSQYYYVVLIYEGHIIAGKRW